MSERTDTEVLWGITSGEHNPRGGHFINSCRMFQSMEHKFLNMTTSSDRGMLYTTHIPE